MGKVISLEKRRQEKQRDAHSENRFLGICYHLDETIANCLKNDPKITYSELLDALECILSKHSNEYSDRYE